MHVMRCGALLALLSLMVGPSSADESYRINAGGHVWTAIPVHMLGGPESVVVAQDRRNVAGSRKFALAIARTYADQHLGGRCAVLKVTPLGKSGWKIDFKCPEGAQPY
ncbi:MAG TPA: hypothetical protein VGG10_16265 [Rhizomicrobium sp.]|jgi:hypothetical protein